MRLSSHDREIFALALPALAAMLAELAGTDADNDLLICDAGEACGAYLTVDQPIRLEVDADLEGLDFPVEYRINIPTLDSLSDQISARTQREIVRSGRGN